MVPGRLTPLCCLRRCCALSRIRSAGGRKSTMEDGGFHATFLYFRRSACSSAVCSSSPAWRAPRRRPRRRRNHTWRAISSPSSPSRPVGRRDPDRPRLLLAYRGERHRAGVDLRQFTQPVSNGTLYLACKAHEKPVYRVATDVDGIFGFPSATIPAGDTLTLSVTCGSSGTVASLDDTTSAGRSGGVLDSELVHREWRRHERRQPEPEREDRRTSAPLVS